MMMSVHRCPSKQGGSFAKRRVRFLRTLGMAYTKEPRALREEALVGVVVVRKMRLVVGNGVK